MSASPASATAAGFTAVLTWSTLAALTVYAGNIPPLQLVAMSFTLAAVLGGLYLAWFPAARRGLGALSGRALALGVAGLFGYHFLYFLALQTAPAVEASLVNYLWPVLIVLFSALLPARRGGQRLTAWHLTGAALAFCGAALAITGGGGLAFSGHVLGYGAAFAAALTWSSYSVLSRLFPEVPSSAVTLSCAATAAGAWIAHIAVEPLVWPDTAEQAAAILALGLGPVGIAFYVWDHGCKHGDLRILGVSAYFAPLLSTALLIALGLAEATPGLWLAAVLITLGALLAAKEMLWRSPASTPPAVSASES
jgi:drug/metabolite transporter (DMT)-like permease